MKPKPKSKFYVGNLQDLMKVLEKHKGNKTKTAEELGCCVRTVRNWVNGSPELAQYRVPPHKRVSKKR